MVQWNNGSQVTNSVNKLDKAGSEEFVVVNAPCLFEILCEENEVS